MSLGVLNNISAIYAQNNLANTQAALSKTLQQLSSGSRINSGADDAAGLSLANGLQASATALSQSAKNASEGVDFLQVADGALSQVTNLLNRAVTLATEASNGTLNSSQQMAANSEYQKILNEIDTINNNTEYNGIHTFAANATLTAGGPSSGLDLVAGTVITFAANGKNVTWVDSTVAAPPAGQFKLTGVNNKLSDLAAAINTGLGSNVATIINNQLVLGGSVTVSGTGAAPGQIIDKLQSAGQSTLQTGSATDIFKPTLAATVVSVDLANGTNIAPLAANWGAGGTGGTLTQLAADINAAYSASVGNPTGLLATVVGNSLVLANGAKFSAGSALTESESAGLMSNATVSVFTSDGTIGQSYNNSGTDLVKSDSGALALNSTSLTSQIGAQAALTAITQAITTVASERGTIGANINTLSAVGNVMTTQSTNTLAAQNDVTATDYGQATSDMSKYQILSQTGIAALSQANQAQQLILKLLQ
jgi:flagellin